jgi:hypothetical protein
LKWLEEKKLKHNYGQLITKFYSEIGGVVGTVVGEEMGNPGKIQGLMHTRQAFYH